MRSKSIDIYAQSYKKLTKIENFQSPAENLIRAIKVDSIAPKNKQSMALDFGSGDGRHTEYLARMGYRVVATDVSAEAIHATKYRVQSYDNVETVLMKPDSKINYPNSSFDLIISWETMHWLGSKNIFLFYMKEFKRLLKKSGCLIITMPTETHYLKNFSVEAGESRYLCEANERRGAIFYSPNLLTLKKIFTEQYEFTISRTLKYEHGRVGDSGLKNMGLNSLFSMYVFNLTKS